MTTPPHDSPAPGPSGEPEPIAYGYARDYDPARDYGYETRPAEDAIAPEEPPAATGRTRRRVVVGATVAGAVVLGGAGFAVAAYLSGGGAQPEDVLPADTIGFVKLDLDPAMSQKAAVSSLLEKFPALEVEDIRQDLVDELLMASDPDVTFDEDVQPWLGDRMAAAVVPDPESEGGVAPVVVLAVEDQEALAASLGDISEQHDFGFAVRDGFVLISTSDDVAGRIAQQESRLSDDADYGADLDALGGDQIAVAWVDLSAAQALLETALAEAAGGLTAQPLSGRVIVGVHAEDDALELVGMDFSVSDAGPGPRPTEPTELFADLPEDTLGVVSLGGAGEAAVKAYDQFAETGGPAEVEEQIASLGLDLPDDLRAVLGTDLVVAAFGDLENPGVGARVATDDPERAIDVLGRLAENPDLGLPFTPSPVDGGYVVGSDPAVIDGLTADGGLGDTEEFQAAVPGADDATAVGFVDLATILEQVPDSGDEGFQPSDLAALEAVGFSAAPTDEGSRFVLRITTR